MSDALEKKITDLDATLKFQAYATAVGMYFLIQKGLLSREEYNEYLKSAEKGLIDNFAKSDELNEHLARLIKHAFSGLYIPDNVGSSLMPPTLFN